MERCPGMLLDEMSPLQAGDGGRTTIHLHWNICYRALPDPESAGRRRISEHCHDAGRVSPAKIYNGLKTSSFASYRVHRCRTSWHLLLQVQILEYRVQRYEARPRQL